jgi:molybdate transport system substrate-binding protein
MTEIKVVSSPPLRSVIREIGPRFEAATGAKLVARIESVSRLKRRIDAGDEFDVAVLTPDLLDALVANGTIAGDARAAIARSALGVAVRAGERVPDVGCAEAFRRALLDARSVMYASGSAVIAHIEQVFERLGIAADIKAKTRWLPPTGHIGHAVADGAAELGLTHIPVILDSPGAQLAGPFPPALQHYVDLCAGVSASSPQPAHARALVRYLATPEAKAIMRANGLEPCGFNDDREFSR